MEDAIAAFQEKRSNKGKKLYNKYSEKDTIAISNKDDDNRMIAKRLKSDPPSPTSFVGLIRVKPKVLIVEEVNEHKAMKEEYRVRMDKGSTEESSVKEEVDQLKVLLLSRNHERAFSQVDQVAVISWVIQGILS